MRTEVNGVQINYEVSGQPDGPAVMMGHSLGCSLRMWDEQAKALESTFKVIRFDMRGHGLSDAPKGEYSFEMLGEDTRGLMDLLNLETVQFVGLSMGGMIGQYLAIHHPNRIKTLVLCDTGPVMPDEAQPIWQQRMDQALEGGMAARVEETFSDWFTPAFLEKQPPALESVRQQLLSTPLDGYIGCIWALRRLNFIDRLKEISCPTLIIVGKEDMGTPVEVAEIMHQMIAGSEMTIIPDASHLSSVEQPEAFNAALVPFLTAHI